MTRRCRYRLERKEPYSLPNILGNHSFPVPTYRWKTIAVSDDAQALRDLLGADRSNYRIIDSEEGVQA